MKVLYLDISHVLHPSESTYVLVHRKSPWTDGHAKYEYLPVLEHLLGQHSDVAIVLSDWTAVVHGFAQAKERLGRLGGRVIASLHKDVTTKVRRTVPLQAGGQREVGYSDNDFRRMSRAQAVRAHVAWTKPEAWVAVTSEYADWSPDERSRHVVITDMVDALGTRSAQAALATALAVNFGSDLAAPKQD